MTNLEALAEAYADRVTCSLPGEHHLITAAAKRTASAHYLAALKAALDLPEVRAMRDALQLRRMHDADCADATEQFEPHEMCECGASVIADVLAAFDALKGQG